MDDKKKLDWIEFWEGFWLQMATNCLIISRIFSMAEK